MRDLYIVVTGSENAEQTKTQIGRKYTKKQSFLRPPQPRRGRRSVAQGETLGLKFGHIEEIAREVITKFREVNLKKRLKEKEKNISYLCKFQFKAPERFQERGSLCLRRWYHW